MRQKTIILLIVGICAVLAVLVVTVGIFVFTRDLAPLVVSYGTKSLGRPVSVGRFQVRWGSPLSVEIVDLHVGNADWGSRLGMIDLGRLSAQIDLWPLLGGEIRYRKLEIQGLSVFLERDVSGKPNWRFGKTGSSATSGSENVPKERAQFPALIDLSARDSNVTLRLSSGSDLTVDIHDLAVKASDEGQPVTIALGARYNGTDVKLHGVTGSFRELQDGAKPFVADISLATPTETIGFSGTMTDPLDIDGVVGRIKIDSNNLGALLKDFSAEAKADLRFQLESEIRRTGDRWVLSGVTGKLLNDRFGGDITLTEAARGNPDHLALSLKFPALDLKALDGGLNPSGSVDDKPTSLRLNPKPGILVDVQIEAVTAAYGATQAANFIFSGETDIGRTTLRTLAADIDGGHVAAASQVLAEGDRTRIAATLSVSHLDANKAARLAGAQPDEIDGDLDGLMTLDMTGASLDDALADSRGQMVFSVVHGRISRALIEAASTDLRALFGARHGSTEMACLGGIVVMENGKATIAPLRLISTDGTLAAAGTADVRRRHVDLTIKAVRSTTGFFALDIPIELSGPFNALHAIPAGSTAHGPDDAAARNAIGQLTPALRRIADRNDCIR